ncbi:MAG TPA: phosphatase PAP2 family protein [Hyphomicrobiaceae bacterium]|jgi:membrane-associated phospholipid phosphatase
MGQAAVVPAFSARRRVITPLAWWSLGGFVAVDLIWLSVSPLRFASSNLWMMGKTTLVMACAFCVLPLILRRLEGDLSKTASGIRIAAYRLDVLARVAAFTVCSGIAAGTYMYLATSAALPLQDARLASLDRALGFDWPAFLASANASPLISTVLAAAYHSALPQMLALYLLLCFSGRERRLAEFLALISVTSVVVGALMLLVPAAGAYAHFHPPRELFDGFGAKAGMWHYETLIRLRSQAAPSLDFAQMEGLVTFPSFHTVLAIITAYAFRGIRFVTLPAVILNGIVIVSTLPEGGHYLVDVIAGAAIAVAGIALVRWERSGWRTRSLWLLRVQRE